MRRASPSYTGEQNQGSAVQHVSLFVSQVPVPLRLEQPNAQPFNFPVRAHDVAA